MRTIAKTKDVVELALACHRLPLEYRDQLVASAPLPMGMTRLLSLANHSQPVLEEASEQTGARPDELCTAARFLIQQLCFAHGADHYRVLGLEPNASSKLIKEHYHQLMRLFHPDRTVGRDTWTEHFASRVNEAWTVLSNSEAKARYDTQIHQSRLSDQLQDSVTLPADTSHRPTDIGYQQGQYSSHSRARIRSFCHWWSVAILTGIALGGTTLLIWVGYPDLTSQGPLAYHPKASIPKTPVVPDQKPPIEQTDRSAISVFLTTPDWNAISQRELQTRQSSNSVRTAQPKIQQVDQPVSLAGEAQLKQQSMEQSRLDHQIDLEQAEQMRLEKELKAEKVWRERMTAERLRQERLQADLDQANRLRIKKEMKSDQHREELATEFKGLRVLDQAKGTPVRIPTPESRIHLVSPGIEPVQPVIESVKATPSSRPAPARIATLRKTAAPNENKLTEREAQKVIDRYVAAYQRGDLHTVMSMFKTDVLVNGYTYGEIRRNFASFFEKQTIQRLELEDQQWDNRGDEASLKARYKLSLWRREGGPSNEATGNIQFVLRKENGLVSIQSMEFDWVRN